MITLEQVATVLGDVIEGLGGEHASQMTERDRMISSITAAALRLARDLAASGQDPVVAIERIRSSLPAVESADRTIDDAIRAKFPPKD